MTNQEQEKGKVQGEKTWNPRVWDPKTAAKKGRIKDISFRSKKTYSRGRIRPRGGRPRGGREGAMPRRTAPRRCIGRKGTVARITTKWKKITLIRRADEGGEIQEEGGGNLLLRPESSFRGRCRRLVVQK